MTEDFQKKFVEYNIYKQQAEGLAKELGLLQSTTQNLEMARQTLSNLGELEEKPEILVPIGGNTFLTAEIKNPKKVLTGIGSDIIVQKDTPSAIETIGKQLSELKQAAEKMQATLMDLDQKMKGLEPALQKFAEEMKKKKESK